MLASCSDDTAKPLTYAVSPDGAWTAAVFIDGDDAGRIALRRAGSSSGYRTLAKGVFPDVFLQWADARHLILWYSIEDAPNRPDGPGLLDGLAIAYKTYDPFAAPRAEPIGPIEARDVRASFAERTTKQGRACLLSIDAYPSQVFTTIGLTITADIATNDVSFYRCSKAKPCGSMDTSFRVGDRLAQQAPLMLTSATVSHLPSYNRLPDGEAGRQIRAQFLGSDASALLETLELATISLDDTFDFIGRSVVFALPTTPMRPSIMAFETCTHGIRFD